MDKQLARQAIDEAKEAMRRRDRVEARRWAQLAARQNPGDEVAWLILGAVAEPRASLYYIQRALEINPQSKSALKGLAWAENRLRQAAAAGQAGQVKHAPAGLRASEREAGQDKITRPIRVRAGQKWRERWAAFWKKGQGTGGEQAGTSALRRVASYTLVRGLTLIATIIASVFLIIYIANLGGYYDEIQKGLISEDINAMLRSGWMLNEPQDQRQQAIDQVRQSMETAYGLDQPYPVRVAGWMLRGLTFDWGNSRNDYVISSTYVDGTHTTDVTTNDIRTEIATFLPRTLLLLGVSNLVLFLVSIQIGLVLIRKPGGWLDRLFSGLAPISSAPSWIFGILLFIIFSQALRNLGLGKSVVWYTNIDVNFVVNLLKALLIPILAIFLSKIFQSIYAWRTYFMTFSNESYLELAKAKGLPPKVLERRYLLRPALPAILTSFALIMISIWQECIAVEYSFNVGGIGSFFMQALDSNDVGVMVALVTTFAFILAITVFILDIAYALVDPRLKIQVDSQSEKPLAFRGRFSLKAFTRRTRPAPLRQPTPWRSPEDQDVEPFPKPALAARLKIIRQRLSGLRRSAAEFWREFSHYRSGVVGAALIGLLILVAVGTVIAIPYDRAIALWRGDDLAWIRNPIEAEPAWTNLFRQQKLPENIQLNSADGTVDKVIGADSSGNPMITINYRFDYANSQLPQDVLVLFHPQFTSKQPFVIMTWITPDGKEIPLKNTAISQYKLILFSSDADIANRLKAKLAVDALFAKPGGTQGEVVQGRYGLRLNVITFEKGSSVDAELVVYGKVYGLAGTDAHRKDLLLVLLWGTVAALAFGILAALCTTLASVTLAAAAAWFGGWVDALIQRISEINMVLPVLPVSILIFFMYSKSIFVILGVTVGLSIFGSSIKNYRAMFLQIKQAPYIEAASGYGASGWRIIFQYLIPKVRTTLIPQLIILVPSYVFFEATLSFLGVSDPTLPTLGKQLVAVLQAGLASQPSYLLLEPVGALVLIALGFALTGLALERMYNEKMGG